MKTSQALVGMALVAGSSQAFLMPGSGLARAPARTAIAPMRMAETPGDHLRKAGDHAKEAGKQALNRAEDAADRTANKAQNAADRTASNVDAKASQASSSTQARTGATAGASTNEVRAQGVQSKEVVREAPLKAVHIHENTEVVDKTKVEEDVIKTKVVQKVQPIHDEERKAVDVKKVDHGTEVRHHGKSGLDAQTKAELDKRREQLAETTGTTRDVTKTHVSERPDVVRNEATQVIEQVVPVLDKDVYIPHREEHEKRVVEVYHEAPELVGTKVEQTISKEEFEKKYGTKLETPTVPAPAAGTTSTTSVTGGVRASGPATPTTSSTSSTTANMSTSAAAKGAAGTTGAGATNYAPGAAQSTYITEHQKQQAAAQRAAAGTTSSSSTHAEDDKVPYSMSSSNMAKDAEEAAEHEDSSSSGGIVSKVKNVVKKIVE